MAGRKIRLKLAWLDQVAFDRDSTSTDFRVAYAIWRQVDAKTAQARVGHGALAERLGLSVRGIEKSIKRLCARGHIEISRQSLGAGDDGRPAFGGRGESNAYRLAAGSPNVGSTFSDDRGLETPNTGSTFSDDRGRESPNTGSTFSDDGALETPNTGSTFSKAPIPPWLAWPRAPKVSS
jgi:hypothetical protein